MAIVVEKLIWVFFSPMKKRPLYQRFNSKISFSHQRMFPNIIHQTNCLIALHRDTLTLYMTLNFIC